MSLTRQQAIQAQRVIPAGVVAAMGVELAAFRRIIGSAQVAARVTPTTHPLESYWLAMEIAVASCRGEAVQLNQLLSLGPPAFNLASMTLAIGELQHAGVIGTLRTAPDDAPTTLALNHRAASYLGNRAVATVGLLRVMAAEASSSA
jgi:hypothetical protein